MDIIKRGAIIEMEVLPLKENMEYILSTLYYDELDDDNVRIILINIKTGNCYNYGEIISVLRMRKGFSIEELKKIFRIFENTTIKVKRFRGG